MTRCPNCSYEASDSFLFCPMCGYHIKTESSNSADNTSTAQVNDNTSAAGIKEEEPRKYFKVVNGLYEYPKAPVGKRLGAYIIDLIILLVLSLPSLVLFLIGFLMDADADSFEDGDFSGTTLIGGVMYWWGFILLIIPGIYYFIKDGLKKGQSYGKRITGIMVIDTQKNIPCKIGKSAFRNLISSLIVSIPFLQLLTIWIEPIMVLARNDGRKAADLVASTQVIDIMHFNGK